MPNQPKTPLRNVRIPDEVWEPARARSKETGIPISQIIVASLAAWAGVRPPPKNRGGRPPKEHP